MKLFRRKPKPARKILFLRKRYLAIPGALLAICALCLVTNLPAYVTVSAGLLRGCFKIKTMLFAIPAMLGNSLFCF